MLKAYATTSESLPFAAPGITIVEDYGDAGYRILTELHTPEEGELCDDEGYFDEAEADSFLVDVGGVDEDYRRVSPWRRKGAQYYAEVEVA